MPYIMYADMEFLIKKIDGWANNPENFSTIKIGEDIPGRYSMSSIRAFDHIENKHTLYHGKDCMKNLYESFREYMKNTIDFEKKKMLLLTKEELKSHQDGNICYICEKRILKKFYKSINNRKDHCYYTGKYRGAAHSIWNLKFNVPNEILVVFCNS